MLTQDYLKSRLDYNPDTGEFLSKVSKGGTKVGMPVGTYCKLGYRRISIDAKLYLAHRLAFLYMTGRMPEGSVDHKDGNPLNNTWENLRECTQSQNLQNMKGHGKYYKNVYFTQGARSKPYNVKIDLNGVTRSFGYYTTPEEADEVASLLRDMFHGEFSISNRNK